MYYARDAPSKSIELVIPKDTSVKSSATFYKKSDPLVCSIVADTKCTVVFRKKCEIVPTNDANISIIGEEIHLIPNIPYHLNFFGR